jgi:hypothetical protein
MNKIDLIIENIEYAKLLKEGAHQNEMLDEALAAARELQALKPVMVLSTGTKLYALDEVTK